MPVSKAASVITRHREDLRWSKRRLARESELSPAYIVQLENGERPVTARILGRIADAMRIHPYVLLGEAGFIPPEHVAEAEAKAAEAIQDPDIAAAALDGDTGGKSAWLVADYLYLLGHDPFGGTWKWGPGGHEIDWTPFAPERMAEADANPETEDIRRRRFPSRYPPKSQAPSPIEGWEDLSDADQSMVQQLVNRLRHRTDDQ